MKSIEEVEKLSIEELEAASSGFKAPEGFRRRIGDAILSEAALATGTSGARRNGPAAVRGVVAALAVAAAVTMFAAPGPTDDVTAMIFLRLHCFAKAIAVWAIPCSFLPCQTFR